MDRRFSNERRSDNPAEDRRKIERFSNAAVVQNFGQIRNFTYAIMAIAFFKGVFHLYTGVSEGTPESLTYAIIAAILLFFMTGFLLRYSSALSAYLKNESVGNLERALEHQTQLFFVTTFYIIMAIAAFAIFG